MTRSTTKPSVIQGAVEQIIYKVNLPTGTSPSIPASGSFTITNIEAGTNVTTTHSSGSPTASGDTITLPKIANLVAGQRYRVAVVYTASGNTVEVWFEISCDF